VKVKPRVKRRIRALSNRKILFENFGPRGPSYLAITGSPDASASAWITPRELRRFIAAAQEALR